MQFEVFEETKPTSSIFSSAPHEENSSIGWMGLDIVSQIYDCFSVIFSTKKVDCFGEPVYSNYSFRPIVVERNNCMKLRNTHYKEHVVLFKGGEVGKLEIFLTTSITTSLPLQCTPNC